MSTSCLMDDDLIRLFKKFAEADTLSFSAFRAAWTELQFSRIHALLLSGPPLSRAPASRQDVETLLQELYASCLTFLSRTVPLLWRVGSIYAIYLLYCSQPLWPPVPCRIGPWEWQRCKTVAATCLAAGPAGRDVHGVLRWLYHGGALVLCAYSGPRGWSSIARAARLYGLGQPPTAPTALPIDYTAEAIRALEAQHQQHVAASTTSHGLAGAKRRRRSDSNSSSDSDSSVTGRKAGGSAAASSAASALDTHGLSPRLSNSAAAAYRAPVDTRLQSLSRSLGRSAWAATGAVRDASVPAASLAQAAREAAAPPSILKTVAAGLHPLHSVAAFPHLTAGQSVRVPHPFTAAPTPLPTTQAPASAVYHTQLQQGAASTSVSADAGGGWLSAAAQSQRRGKAGLVATAAAAAAAVQDDGRDAAAAAALLRHPGTVAAVQQTAALLSTVSATAVSGVDASAAGARRVAAVVAVLPQPPVSPLLRPAPASEREGGGSIPLPLRELPGLEWLQISPAAAVSTDAAAVQLSASVQTARQLTVAHIMRTSDAVPAAAAAGGDSSWQCPEPPSASAALDRLPLAVLSSVTRLVTANGYGPRDAHHLARLLQRAQRGRSRQGDAASSTADDDASERASSGGGGAGSGAGSGAGRRSKHTHPSSVEVGVSGNSVRGLPRRAATLAGRLGAASVAVPSWMLPAREEQEEEAEVEEGAARGRSSRHHNHAGGDDDDEGDDPMLE